MESKLEYIAYEVDESFGIADKVIEVLEGANLISSYANIINESPFFPFAAWDDIIRLLFNISEIIRELENSLDEMPKNPNMMDINFTKSLREIVTDIMDIENELDGMLPYTDEGPDLLYFPLPSHVKTKHIFYRVSEKCRIICR